MKEKSILTKCVMLMLIALVLFASGCRTTTPPVEEPVVEKPEAVEEIVSKDAKYKIGIMTGTVSQGEEEYQEALNQVAKYGDLIVHATYPDQFSTEMETTISRTVEMASDPEVKAIVFVQAVPGAAAAIDKVHETRPDMVFIAGVPAEDPAVIAGKANIVMQVDEISMGVTIPTLAYEMGAKTFIHYSFPRHLSYATIARRLEIMKETCAKLGIELVEVTAPDPTGDAGMSGAQQFIVEDVPRQIATYGKDTAFFSTNCGLQEPLIRMIWEGGAIYPQQCCPSPYHGYPAALNIDVSGHEGDVPYMLEQIAAKLKEKGQEGRMSTWGVPINMLMIDAGVRFAIEYAEGRVDPNDTAAFKRVINEAAAARGVGEVTITSYDEEVKLDNFLMLLCPFHDFSGGVVTEKPAVEPYKIGIMTGTVSQGEEEYQEALNQVAKYGDLIVHATYPDQFSTEMETTISRTVEMASDPEVKAIVFVQAVPGAAAAIDKVHETRPDMVFIAGVPAEDPAVIAGKANIVMQVDEISMGVTIPTLAYEMGAKTFIHYSFPRHLSYATIARRLEIMKETCAKLGIELVEVTAPDPTGDAGMSGAQQFIVEDVPRQIATYGKDTAFFSTNCGLQEPLIRMIWEGGAIYPQQCCPSPYHGYPAALNIDVSGHEGDVPYMLEQIAAKLKEKGQEGRMSTWGVPINMLMIDAGVRFAIEYAEGRVDPNDAEAFKRIINEAAAARGVGEVTITSYDEEVKLDNFLMLLCPFHDFSK